MKNIKNILSILSFVIITTSFIGCGNNTTASKASQQKQSTKSTITDATGKGIEVPTKINRIGDAWPAHNEVLAMLGQGNKIVSTVLTKKGKPWLYKVNSQMNKATTVFTSADVNIEQMLKTKPDVVFLPPTYKYADKIKSVGIPAVQLTFTDYTGLKKCFKITGDILGLDAKKKAVNFNSYLDSKLKMVTDITSKIPSDKKPKVLHIYSLSPLMVDGNDTIIDAWIKVAGGVNAASEIKGNMKEASMEQIMKWNPDIIIMQSDAKNQMPIMKTDVWKNISAVKNGKVIVNPNDAFSWDRYGAESALQIQWAAKLLHPDKFQNLDIATETMNFYKQFLNYNLTKEEANQIIDAAPPSKSK